MRREDVQIFLQCDEPGCRKGLVAEGSSVYGCEKLLALKGWHVGQMGGCDFCPAHNTQKDQRERA